MIISGFGAIFTLILVGIALLVLLILAFYRWRLALAGFVALMLWLFVPVAKQHLSHAYTMSQSPHDYFRILNSTSDPETMAGFGVAMPADAPFQRCYTGWSNNPAHCLWFEIPTDLSPSPITFRIYALGDVEFPTSHLLRDRSACITRPTDVGLLLAVPGACETGWSGHYHARLTPDRAPTAAIFVNLEWDDPDEIRLFHFRHGPYSVAGSANGVAMEQWREPIALITDILDSYFVVIPPP